ncbi:hypothetical protein ACV274_002176 [Enterobacter ludwigii]
MSNATSQTLDAQKLYENAIASIQLGLEDFQLSQKPSDEGGNPARTLSSVRNLYAGMLLLFKYRIAISVESEDDAYQLIHNPPYKILPHPDGAGGVEWKPDGKFKQTTIDVSGIAERFEKFKIAVDWKAIDKLQFCRNELEHLHPRNTFGELAGFVAELFPVLSDFITNELDEVPQETLGHSWEIMLAHQTFYNQKAAECKTSWEEAGIPEGMFEFLEECGCGECGSKLIRASQRSLDDGYSVGRDEEKFNYQCISCAYIDLIAPMLLEVFDKEFFYWPPDGEEPTYEECYNCRHDTFVIGEQICRWCEHTLDYTECSLCGAALMQDDQDNDGLCGYCNYRVHKD